MATAGELEQWVREEMSLATGEAVAISEKPGTDPRCSSTVTEVAVGQPEAEAFVFHVEQPLADLTRMDLIAALAFGGH